MGLAVAMDPIIENEASSERLNRKETQQSKDSQTAADFIDEQLALEADAREALPYKFDKCTYHLGALRQEVYACLTCNPPPASAAQVYTPAGICYACSISCHGDHTLAELFNRRNFVCDCGTTRIPSTSPCTLRSDPNTGRKGVASQEPAKGNSYNHNFQNTFCACGEEYDADNEKGTMFQCIGLGTVETGGCGEDWYHPECLMGLPRDWNASTAEEKKIESAPEKTANGEHAAPPGFPSEDDFEALVCYKCVAAYPWIKRYAGTTGFLPQLYKKDLSVPQPMEQPPSAMSNRDERSVLKRKASDDEFDGNARSSSPSKRLKEDDPHERGEVDAADAARQPPSTPKHKHSTLPTAPAGTFSLFLKEDFREHLCHCPSCYPNLLPHPQLVEEEDNYEPSVSNDSGVSNQHSNPLLQSQQGSDHRSHRSGSLLDRGEAALNNIDRVRAIEGVMVYNHLKDKVKEFLKPYAESGEPVSAADIKSYFEKLRGDEQGIKEAGQRAEAEGSDDKGDGNRKEQSGY